MARGRNLRGKGQGGLKAITFVASIESMHVMCLDTLKNILKFFK